MAQYTPQPGLTDPLLSRRIYGGELRAAKAYLAACGVTEGYTQDLSSAQSTYTPDFDLTGV